MNNNIKIHVAEYETLIYVFFYKYNMCGQLMFIKMDHIKINFYRRTVINNFKSNNRRHGYILNKNTLEVFEI